MEFQINDLHNLLHDRRRVSSFRRHYCKSMLVIRSKLTRRTLINNALLSNSLHAVEQRAEWAYCFDVHCNSFIPVYLGLYVVQFLFLPLINASGILPLVLSNILYLGSLCGYWYLTFLGYSALPFVSSSSLFLVPIGMLTGGIGLVSLMGINVSVWRLSSYWS